MVRTYIADVLFLAGAGSMTYGAWTLAPFAGFIVGGAFLILSAIAVTVGKPK